MRSALLAYSQYTVMGECTYRPFCFPFELKAEWPVGTLTVMLMTTLLLCMHLVSSLYRMLWFVKTVHAY